MKNVLVVDDSATSRAILRACMPKDAGVEVFDAFDEASALSKMNEVNPVLCFMDYNMPEKNGTDVAQALMDAGYVTKFILMTANMQQAVVDRAKGLGFIGFIEKPVTPHKLQQLLGEINE